MISPVEITSVVVALVAVGASVKLYFSGAKVVAEAETKFRNSAQIQAEAAKVLSSTVQNNQAVLKQVLTDAVGSLSKHIVVTRSATAIEQKHGR